MEVRIIAYYHRILSCMLHSYFIDSFNFTGVLPVPFGLPFFHLHLMLLLSNHLMS